MRRRREVEDDGHHALDPLVREEEGEVEDDGHHALEEEVQGEGGGRG